MEEKLLESWVVITSLLKKTKMTKSLTYNESIIMLYIYKNYNEGITEVSIKEITEFTNITKSLLNRTINSLIKKNMLVKVEGEGDARLAFVSLVEENIKPFINVHNSSINKAKQIVSIIGKSRTKSFIESVNMINREMKLD